MYNRYVPQSDGSFQRCRIPEERPEPPRRDPPSNFCPPPAPQPPQQQKPMPQKCPRPQPRPYRQERPPEHQGGNILSFFRQILPRDFDTGDLLVVILLLLMSSDCQEDQNTALLTLALYLFL